METKSPKILLKSVKYSQDKAGGDVASLSLSQEEAGKLLDAVNSFMDNQRGVKLRVHVYDNVSEKTGREFKSGIIFVDPIQEPQAGQGRTVSRFVPRTKAAPTQTQETETDEAPATTSRKTTSYTRSKY